MGIDPGTARMGWGVVEEIDGGLHLVDCGVIATPAGTSQPVRLLQLYNDLCSLIERYRPDAAAIEELFFGKNVNTALTVGQARGIALLAFAQAGISVYEYKPLQVKQALAGYGGADKRQMQEMVRLTLRLPSTPRPDDAADAVAVAICHAYAAPMIRRLEDYGDRKRLV